MKAQIKLLKKCGININGTYFDNKIAHYLVNPDLSHNYKTLCEAYLNYSPSIKNDSFDQSAMENSWFDS